MTKKNLKPQQAAPVQREINTTSSVGGTGLTPHAYEGEEIDINGKLVKMTQPFAGDDAE
jgi:prenylated cyclic peptide (anacyclamide/piricyclamide family)